MQGCQKRNDYSNQLGQQIWVDGTIQHAARAVLSLSQTSGWTASLAGCQAQYRLIVESLVMRKSFPGEKERRGSEWIPQGQT